MGIRATTYHLNLVARKFGLSQLLPKSLTLKEDIIFFSTEKPGKEWLMNCKVFFGKNKVILNSLGLSLSFHFTKEFED